MKILFCLLSELNCLTNTNRNSNVYSPCSSLKISISCQKSLKILPVHYCNILRSDYLQHSPTGATQPVQTEIASNCCLAGRRWHQSSTEQKVRERVFGGACTPASPSCQLALWVPLPAVTCKSNPVTRLCTADSENRNLLLADFGTILTHKMFELAHRNAQVDRCSPSDMGKFPWRVCLGNIQDRSN